MSAIVPRWEWRGFGAGAAGDVESDTSGGARPTGCQESDELYLLSAAGPTTSRSVTS